MEPAYRLRVSLRRYASTQRIADCGRRAVADVPALVLRATVNEHGERIGSHAHWSGVLRCGRQYACPVCCSARAAERAAQLDAMLQADLTGRWQMCTFTMRHKRGESLRDLMDLILGAWRRVRAMRSMREIFDRRVTASARAAEVTFGFANGWHPHLHIMWRTTPWSRSEREALQREWCAAIGAERYDARRSVRWSKAIGAWCSERAKYLAKLGAEVAGIAKLPKFGNHTPWQIAERARSEAFGVLWREYQEAMRGRRVLELDERARKLADDGAAAEPEEVREWRLLLYPEEFRAIAAFEREDPAILWLVLDSVEFGSGPDPPRIMRAIVDDILRWRKTG